MSKKRKIYLESAPFLPNRGIEIKYAKKLKSLCRKMIDEYSAALKEFYRNNKAEFAVDGAVDVLKNILQKLNNKYTALFISNADILPQEMIREYNSYLEKTFDKRMSSILPTQSNIEKILKQSEVEYMPESIEKITESAVNLSDFVIHAKPITADIEKAMNVAILENASLIKSIPPQYIERVSGAVTRALQNGMSNRELAGEIYKYGQMTMRRASNIANDQSRKSYVSLSKVKMQKAGIKKFRWVHVGGSIHPREYHLKDYPHGLNNGIFDIDNPPVIDKRTGEKGFPAQLPYCRCIMQAVFEMD